MLTASSNDGVPLLVFSWCQSTVTPQLSDHVALLSHILHNEMDLSKSVHSLAAVPANPQSFLTRKMKVDSIFFYLEFPFRNELSLQIVAEFPIDATFFLV